MVATIERVELYTYDYWKLRCRLKGVTGILMNNPAAMQQARGDGGRGKNIPTPEDEAERGTYRMENGNLYVPAIALRNCILGACSRGDFKAGRKSLKSLLAAALLIEPEELELRRDGLPINTYRIDSRRAVIQKAAIIRNRPEVVTPWELDFTAYVDTTLYRDAQKLNQIVELFNFAGQFVGLLDYRPACLGWFGRFRVEIEGL